MSPVLEIVKVNAAEAYLNDKSSFSPAATLLAKAPGHIATYHGVEVQESQYAYVVNVWESLAHHEALVADKEAYSKLEKEFGGIATGIVYLNHATFNADPFTALNAPTTEFALWTLKEGADSKVFQEKVNALVTLAISWGPASGIHKGGWGPVSENSKQFYVLLGWDSLEIFTKAVQASPEAQSLIGEIKELAELDLKHAILTKF